MEPFKGNKYIYFINDWKPDEIERIHCTYSAAFIVPKKGDIIIVQFKDYKDYQVIEKIKKFAGEKKIIFPISPNGKNFPYWSKDNHNMWSDGFKKIVLSLMVIFHVKNKEKKMSFVFPKVLIYEIIKIISIYQY
jgi:hypothetical protein